jgi:hypothetical protein
VDIYLDSGTHLKRVPVASREWVISGEDADKKYNSGERNLPPEHSRVFVMMPARTYADCFVAPFSGFSTIGRAAPYMEDDKEKIKERITPGGWHITGDYVTGSRKAVSPDKKTSIEIDYGTKAEPKGDAPELHFSLFDEIKGDVVTDDSVEVSVFNEAVIKHKKGEKIEAEIGPDVEIAADANVTETIREDLDILVAGDDKKTVGGNREEKVAGNAKYESADTDIKSIAPIGLNDGLYKTGLSPYWTSETSALSALSQAAAQAAPQLALLDAFSGGTGFIIGLGAAIAAFCAAMQTADGAAHAATAKAVK